MNAFEIRCNRISNACQEAFATILHHTEGQDLEAQVFSYKVRNWEATKLGGLAERTMGECSERRVVINIPEASAVLSWTPPSGCVADEGRSVWVGDPL